VSVQPPPIYEILSNEEGKAELPWTLFFNQVYDGDAGTAWTPTFQNLGTTGTPTITGRYYRLSNYLNFFSITITPATDTTSTAGTTYCDNFPLAVSNDGACIGVGGALGLGAGIVQGTTGRIYPPAWTSVTVPVTIVGLVEAA